MMRSDNPISRLALGTAQMGVAYGVANRTGLPDHGAIAEILTHAKSAGIRSLETSSTYGDIEPVLGKFDMSGWAATFKLPPLSGLEPEVAAATVKTSIQSFAERLKRVEIWGVLLDSITDLDGPTGRAVRNMLGELMVRAWFGWSGVSLSSSADLEQLPEWFERGVLQVPFNPLDQRLLRYVPALSVSRDIHIHARSLFLQGLLLMRASERPAYFNRWSRELARFDERAAELGVSRLALCLGCALAVPQIDKFVVGVETPAQLEEIIEAVKTAPTQADLEDLACNDSGLVDPPFWEIEEAKGPPGQTQLVWAQIF